MSLDYLTKTMLNEFLDYRNRGFSVIPVKRSKEPLILSWKEFQSRIASEEEIKQWLATWPDAQLAIITGKVSNLTALDIDIYNGADSTPYNYETTTVKSGSGGIHLWFKHYPGLRNSHDVIAPHVGVKSEGGYIIVPPSKNNVGEYSFIKKVDELLPFPDQLIKELALADSTTNNSSLRD